MFLLLLMLPAVCHAGGYGIYEMNAEANGMAHAFICRVSDASAVWYNPAALTRIEKNDLYLSGTLIAAQGDFDPTIQPGIIDQKDRTFFRSMPITAENFLITGLSESAFTLHSDWQRSGRKLRFPLW